MAKIKVHELAKELELQSKDILNFLQEKGIEAKAAQSSLEEDAAALVRKSLGHKSRLRGREDRNSHSGRKRACEGSGTQSPKQKAQETTTENKGQDETKKKKKIIFVSNPQNSKMSDSVRAVRTDRDREMPADSARIRGQISEQVTRTIPYGNRVQAQAPVRPSSR